MNQTSQLQGEGNFNLKQKKKVFKNWTKLTLIRERTTIICMGYTAK